MLKTAKVVGLNSDLTAALALISQGEDSVPKQPEDGSLLPYLFIIVACSTDDAFSRVRQCLSEAESTFYSTPAPIPEKLTQTTETIKQSLSDVEDLRVLVASYQDDSSGSVLYLMTKGDFLSAYLIRGDKHTNLAAGAGEYQLVSGVLQEGDRVVMATESLLTLLGGSIEVLAQLPIENLEDEVEIRLPEAENYPVAAIVIEKEKIVPEEENIEIHPTENKKVEHNRTIPRFKQGLAILGGLLLVVILGAVIYSYKYNKDAKNLAKINNSLQVSTDESTKAQALKNFPVGDFPLWLDLDLVKKGFSAKKLSLSHGKILLLDTDKKSLIEVMTNTKSPELLAGEEQMGKAELASLNGDLAWVFSGDKGVVQVDTKNNQAKVMVKTDQDWGSITQIFGFAGNVYLLDSGKPSTGSGQIWKYLPILNGYSDKRVYFKADTKANLAGTKAFQIDSSVWVLKSGGEIIKYTQGSVDYFSMGGLDKGLKDPQSFFVSDETDNLYILDSGNNRLVVVDKKGVYQAQYQSEKFAVFSDVVVDEQGKKVYLLGESKIFSMELK